MRPFSKLPKDKELKGADLYHHLKSLTKEELETELFKKLNQQSIAKEDDDDEGAAESKHSEQLRNSLQDVEVKDTATSAEYLTDERSGDDVTDSDREFEDIVELDNILKSILDSTLEVSDLHAKISQLFSKMRQLKDLIEFDSPDIKDICENIASRELLFFTSFSSVVKIAETAYFIQIPYRSFWKGLMNVVLVNYHEMEINHVIQLIYYTSKMGFQEFTIDPALLSENQQAKLTRIQKVATHKLMIAYL